MASRLVMAGHYEEGYHALLFSLAATDRERSQKEWNQQMVASPLAAKAIVTTAICRIDASEGPRARPADAFPSARQDGCPRFHGDRSNRSTTLVAARAFIYGS